MSNGQLLHELRHDWGEYFPFLISFVVIANHWTVHRKIFRYVNRLNTKVIVANMVWLLMVILIPFATRMSGRRRVRGPLQLVRAHPGHRLGRSAADER